MREAAGLAEGTAACFELTAGGLLVRPDPQARDPEQAWFWTDK